MAVTQLGTFIEKQTANLKLKHDLVHSSNFEKDVEGILHGSMVPCSDLMNDLHGCFMTERSWVPSQLLTFFQLNLLFLLGPCKFNLSLLKA